MTSGGAEPEGIVGRAPEIDELGRLLAALDDGVGGVVVLDGEPGIGKTTLLDWVADRIHGSDEFALVRLDGVEVERELAYGGLHALVRQLANLGIEPPADDAAVLNSTTSDGPRPGALAIGSSVLAAITARPRLVVLVDDAQWLDAPSASALAFACRRLTAEPTLLIVAERTGAPSVFVGPRIVRRHLSGLSVEAAAELLVESPPAVVATCVERTAGNPLGLLELARGLSPEQLRGVAPLPADLPVGGRLVAAFAGRVAALSEGCQRALSLLAASSADDTAFAASALLTVGGTAADLVPAEAAGIVEFAGDTVRLAHPLHRPAIADAVGPAVMRDAHRRLAGVVTDPERRALHLAAAATGADATVSAALEQSASTAVSRGAPGLAAVLFERAASFAVDAATRSRLDLEACRAWWDACDGPRALATADRVLTSTASDVERAVASGIRGEATAWTVDNRAGVEILATAARAPGLDPVQAAVLLLHASLQAGLGARPIVGWAFADETLASAPPGSPVEVAARAVRALSAQRLGERETADADLEACASLAELAPADAVWAVAPLQAMGLTLLVQGRWREATDVVDLAIATARLHGHDSTTYFASALRGEIAVRTGRPADALATAMPVPGDEVDLARVPHTFPFLLAVVARAEAVLGRLDAARQHAEQARAAGVATRMWVLVAWSDSALGHVALAEGRLADAVAHLTEAAERTAEIGDPGDLWFEGDLAEALVGLGDLEGAAHLAERVGAAGLRAQSPWGTAIADRIRGCVRRDPGPVLASAEALEGFGARFEAARSLLVAAELTGDVAVAARAASGLSACGAVGWAARARALGGAATPVAAAVAAQLSDAELRVAVLVGQGKSNRQIASDLVLSARTVEAHLRAIYRKLDITSRTQLTAAVVRELG